MKPMSKARWNSYAHTLYTHQVGTDARATGGCHRHESPGAVEAIGEAEGLALFARAEAY